MSPRKVSTFAATEQPINWVRAFLCGAGGISLMMAFMDAFNMLGFTDFSFEVYLGSLFIGNQYATHAWTVGLMVNWIIGGIFGCLYGYFFEYFFKKATPRFGIALGLGHALLAAIAFFPFFNAMHEFSGSTYRYVFNSATAILLVIAHLFFGAFMGQFYGPVRNARVRARFFEPGEIGQPGDSDLITAEESPEDRVAV